MIVSSEIISAGVQIDGRKTVTELHTDQIGKTYYINYMADSDINIVNVMNNRVRSIDKQLTENELDEILYKDDPENYTPIYVTQKEMKKSVLQHFLTNKAENVFNLIPYIENLTDAELSEDVGGGKVAKVKTRVQSLKTIKVDLDDDLDLVEVID